MGHGLIEIAEQDAATAKGGFGIFLHALQLLGVERFLPAFVDE